MIIDLNDNDTAVMVGEHICDYQECDCSECIYPRTGVCRGGYDPNDDDYANIARAFFAFMLQEEYE